MLFYRIIQIFTLFIRGNLCIVSYLYATSLLLHGQGNILLQHDNLPAGYPKQVSFRQESPAMLEADEENIQMVVSDHNVWTRQFGHEAFAHQFPMKPVLVHVGGDFISANAYSPKQMMLDRGLFNGDMTDRWIQVRRGFEEVLREDFVPMPDFLGYWVYEAGLNATEVIEAGQTAVIRISDPERYAPRVITPNSERARLRDLTGDDKVPRIVLICPRDEHGVLNWPQAELGQVVSTHINSGTIVVRRFDAGNDFPAIPAGAYIATSAPIWDRIITWGQTNLPEEHPFHYPVWQFFMPNFTPLCPVDPSTGLNAAQWFARHFNERKKKYYPNSGGFALDVTTDTHFPKPHHVTLADIDNDGVVDQGFIDGLSWWALGMHDFVFYMREGVEGIFDGLGDELLVTWDATDNNDQRLFHLLNGAEFEHTMIHGIGWGPMQHKYSSNLDRLLLWGERAQEPNITFISNKYPDEAYHGGTVQDLMAAQQNRPSYALQYKRLDLASACMATGYFHSTAGRGNPSILNDYPGKREQTTLYGAPLLQKYDEFHCGSENINSWLGQPLGPPVRYRDHLGPVLYAFSDATTLPVIITNDSQWWALPPERTGNDGFRLTTEQTGAYTSSVQSFTLNARLPSESLNLEEMEEYAVSFNIRGSSPYAHVDPRYQPIPKNISVRFRVDDRVFNDQSPSYYRAKGYYQECMVFEESRQVHLTIQAPATGKGVLEICISEVPGTIEITNLEIRKGCADVLYREFENGLVILNGSRTSPVDLHLSAIYPDQTFRRINGTQDIQHNDGQLAGNSIIIPASDAFLLLKDSFLQHIADPEHTGDLLLFPNPGTTFMHAKISNSQQGEIYWHVIDAMGRQVLSGTGVNRENLIRFDISGLMPGIYFFSLISNGHVLQEKFIAY